MIKYIVAWGIAHKTDAHESLAGGGQGVHRSLNNYDAASLPLWINHNQGVPTRSTRRLVTYRAFQHCPSLVVRPGVRRCRRRNDEPRRAVILAGVPSV